MNSLHLDSYLEKNAIEKFFFQHRTLNKNNMSTPNETKISL